MSYAERAVKYAEAIISGKIQACQFVKLAMRRFLKDRKRKDLILSEDGERWCRFQEKLPHVKGKWAARAELFKLSDWEIFCTINLYGWKWKRTGLRRFREAYIEVPRKNGKSFYMASLGIGHLAIDGEHGAEVYTGATSEKQAWEVFRPAKTICELDSELRADFAIEVNAKTLAILANGSRFEPVIGKPGDGASPSCAIADEFHEHADSDQVDTFTTGMGAREQPMMLYITTAGTDMGGPCYAKRDDIIKILTGAVKDDRVFGIIYGLDEGDAWDTVAAQKKANPNYGISVDADFLAGQLAQARRSAEKQSSYKTKHLNMWTGAKLAWMNMLALQACTRKTLDIEKFKGRPCFVGIDLATKTDLASMAILFPPEIDGGKWAVFCRHYLPEAKILEGGNTRYKAWHAAGWIEATPGEIIDYDYIEQELEALKSEYEILEVPYDPFQATQFSTRMTAAGFPMVEYGATVKNFSEFMQQLEALVLNRQIEFDNDPVLFWMFGNVVATRDRKDNIFPNKERPENKIDGVVAIIMALARAIVHQDQGTPHVAFVS